MKNEVNCYADNLPLISYFFNWIFSIVTLVAIFTPLTMKHRLWLRFGKKEAYELVRNFVWIWVPVRSNQNNMSSLTFKFSHNLKTNFRRKSFKFLLIKIFRFYTTSPRQSWQGTLTWTFVMSTLSNLTLDTFLKAFWMQNIQYVLARFANQ